MMLKEYSSQTSIIFMYEVFGTILLMDDCIVATTIIVVIAIIIRSLAVSFLIPTKFTKISHLKVGDLEVECHVGHRQKEDGL